jgi:hypothetical protein
VLIISLRKSCCLPVAALFWLLATAPAQGADAGKARDVSIPGTGLALRVAKGVAVSPEKPAHAGDAILRVEVETIDSFRRNGVVSIADVLAQRAALNKGQATVADGWAEAGLSDIVRLPIGSYAVIYPWYSPFDICELEFTMNAVFFVGDRRVSIRYSAPSAAIIKEAPNYFVRDETNCRATIWRHPEPDDVLERFHAAVKAARLGPVANAWYSDFLAILASLRQKRSTK